MLNHRNAWFGAAFLAGLLLLRNTLAHCASLTVQVNDASGQPASDTVVYAEPISGQALPKVTRTAQIEQKARKFLPLVTVVQTGTEISFPNNDSVRHHVYSFSAPKIFDIKLYSGVPSNPEKFDKPGTVVIGCNIHDQMVAYIHVVNTAYFGKTDAAGKVRIDGLPNGKYVLKAWHYALPVGAAIPEEPLTIAGNDASAAFKLNIKTPPASN